jgi:subtilisin-like proprotein convertase family protein
MLGIANEIASLRTSSGSSAGIDRLQAEYDMLSRWLGGDDPANFGRVQSTAPSGPLAIVNPVCTGSIATTTHVPGTGGVISVGGNTPVLFTAVVSGMSTYLWDINLNTAITHTGCADLDITLTSPAGTVVVITTDNGGTNDNVFNGTLWDDNVNSLVAPLTSPMDRAYTNLVTATPLNSEGRLAAFRGEDPNGTWTLSVTDDLATNTGSVNSWSLDISALASSPGSTSTTFSSTPALTIADLATVQDTMPVAGVGTYLEEVSVYTEILHTYAADLDITLQSPAGTIVQLTTDNGGGNDNVFNGTIWDNDAPIPVTDNVYVNLTAAPLLAPEGAFDNFLGQDPNGSWKLIITDDAGGDVGTLVRWDLTVAATSTPVVAPATTNFAGTTGAIPDAGAGGPSAVSFTTTASGIGTYLWDVDLSTAINHSLAADIDMKLTSPAGTVVFITTDNGIGNNFNGTLWDDNSNVPVTDVVYGGGTVATVSPEGRLSAFRGENPNGVWKLDIADDAAGNGGSLTSWALDLTTLSSAPTEASTTFSKSPGLAILDVATVFDTQPVSGIGTFTDKVVLYTEITHTFAADLDITLTSPGGTVVTITTDNGGGNDNVFNGTTFDPDVLDTVTDHVYTNLVTATPLSPEGAFDNFAGQDPNGTWTLTITDDLGGDVGILARWDLTITTCSGVSLPTAYCTAGTSTNGCVPSISGNAQPSVSLATTPIISIANVEGQKFGIIFYGVNNSGFTPVPWSPTSSSFLCVKGPTQRTPSQLSNGTLNACDGTMTLDWNAYQTANPLSVGNPWSAGDKVYVQGWYRDPPASKTTNLSDALEMTYVP